MVQPKRESVEAPELNCWLEVVDIPQLGVGSGTGFGVRDRGKGIAGC